MKKIVLCVAVFVLMVNTTKAQCPGGTCSLKQGNCPGGICSLSQESSQSHWQDYQEEKPKCQSCQANKPRPFTVHNGIKIYCKDTDIADARKKLREIYGNSPKPSTVWNVPSYSSGTPSYPYTITGRPIQLPGMLNWYK